MPLCMCVGQCIFAPYSHVVSRDVLAQNLRVPDDLLEKARPFTFVNLHRKGNKNGMQGRPFRTMAESCIRDQHNMLRYPLSALE